MLSQEYRLRRDKDFQRVFSKGKSVFDSACGVRFDKNNKKNSRFAIVVGTKVHKSAVKRNKIRRQYSEILRLSLDVIKPGFDVILLTSKAALELDYDEKHTRLFKVFKKAGLL
ncbi:MAG: ribonuclease P protein component [Patescibacteria group bacterium]